MKKKKFLLIVFGALAAVLAVTGIVIAFLLNYDNSSPSPVKIVDDGQNVFFKVSANENYRGYRFKLVDGEDEILIDSESNILAVDDIVDIQYGVTYKISACYLGENEGANSNFSTEVDWKAYTYLITPKISYDSKSNTLSWNEIEGADYYKIFYTGKKEGESIIKEESLSLENFEGGVWNFSIVACSYKDYLKTSIVSNSIEVTYTKELKPFISATLDSENKVIKVVGEEKLEKIILYIDGKATSVENFKLFQDGETFIYEINIKAVYSSSSSYGVAPANIDEYNIYTGAITQI